MMKSMTGFGSAEQHRDGKTFRVEMRSVNHRFLEISIRMPREFSALEDRIKKKVQEKVKRGRIDIYITIGMTESVSSSLRVNWGLASEYMKVYDEMSRRFGRDEPISIVELLRLPEVVKLEEEPSEAETWADPLLSAVGLACDQLMAMRETEGKQLVADLFSRIEKLNNWLSFIKKHAPQVVEEYRERIHRRMAEFLDNRAEIDEARLLNEVAIFAERADIEEEITRLSSHCLQFVDNLHLDEPVGRKLDFLLQEMNREINTIGAKANDLQIGQWVVEIKSELEKMKEQVQNIE